MAQRPAAATEAAHRFWTRAVGELPSEEAGSATVQIQSRLREGLSRWIGAEGFRALSSRATALVEQTYPLREIVSMDADEPGITAAIRLHGHDQVTTVLIAQLAAAIELLGRIIGEEMAMHVVQQALTTNSTGTGRRSAGDRND